MNRLSAAALAAVMVTAACSDLDTPSEPKADRTAEQAAAPVEPEAPPEMGVGTLGVIESIKPQEQGLVLYQTGFDVEAGPRARVNHARHEFAVGARHARLQVHIGDDTQIYIDGDTAAVSDLEEGMHVVVVGRVTGASLHAELISNTRTLAPPPEDVQSILPAGMSALPPMSAAGAPEVAASASRCLGQPLSFSDPQTLSFQGCFGGYSAAGAFNIGFVPILCPIFGCLGINQLTYNAGLAGWGYAFPFRFTATPVADLVYHVPGDVRLAITPQGMPDGTFSFWGGLGLDFGIRLVYCFFKCWEITTIHPSVFTMAHEAKGAAPLSGQTLEIAETSCPKILGIPIEGVPIDPIAVHLCEDLTLHGAPFRSRITSTGAAPAINRFIPFDAGGAAVRVRPDATSVALRFGDFWWQPDLAMGMFLRLKIFMVKVADTPTLPIHTGQFDAITTPFPPNWAFTLATDPRSPIDDLRDLPHPTAAWAYFDVQPAPTHLVIASPLVLVEGAALRLLLQEAYDGSPIAGQSVTLRATGLNGTAPFDATGVTGADGAVGFVLPVGEYEFTASYAGADTYLPSSASGGPLYVYRPTTFVIWGGNPGGVVPGQRYQFWGAGWWKQVTAGDFGGNASFLGFAQQVSATEWASPPASSAPAPGSVPDLIGVIVSTRTWGRGSSMRGDIAGWALLRVERPQSYRPDGGHAAWGVFRRLLD